MEKSLEAKTDETTWCSSFANWCMKQAGIKGTRSAGARDWAKWGTKLNEFKNGALTLVHNLKDDSYHVAFAIKLTETSITLAGGNQSNSVKFTSFNLSKYEVVGYYCPK